MSKALASSIPRFRRPAFQTVLARIAEERRFVQVLAGPRQVGKTTIALQVADVAGLPYHYASADEATLRDRGWISAQWEIGRLRTNQGKRALLILDEVQKIPGWSETIKRLWDEDTRSRFPLKVIVLGSSPLLVQRGLTESLAGRFEVMWIPHWAFAEMRTAFGWNLEQFLFFGGYPGAAPLISDQERWTNYILNSLVETAISRDILLLSRVDKPALLRQLFQLGCDYSGQILAYNKMLGQLQDAGNTTTLAHYLQLLGGAGLLTGLEKYSGSRVRQRSSSPKLLALNTALITATSRRSFSEAREDPEFWGRLVESGAGAHLVNTLWGTRTSVFYWREGNHEVDYVVQRGRLVTAIEVTSGAHKDTLEGMAAFVRTHRNARELLVGGQGVPLAEFLGSPVDRWFA